jgi:hypothetical protein
MKKALLILFALAMILSSFRCVFANEAPGTVYGDANGDGKINARDVVAIMRHIVDKDYQIDVRAANVRITSLDADFGPEINSRDVIILMKYLVGGDIVLGKETVTSIPAASAFSDKKFEVRLDPIVRIKSAVLYKDGTQTEFAPDDPRIIRLVNFISYPENDLYLSYEMDGCWNDEQIAKKRSESFRMEIEVENTSEYGNHMYSSFRYEQFDRLVIFKNEVLEYSYRKVDKTADDGVDFWVTDLGCDHCAESYFPYEGLGYVNILEWCGF